MKRLLCKKNEMIISVIANSKIVSQKRLVFYEKLLKVGATFGTL